MSGRKSSVYFTGLNAFRFFAAALVVVGHVELLKEKIGIPNFYDIPFFNTIGHLSVTFFFVLSGFLITYLLLKEKQESAESRINIKIFYLKRVLRIWPVYFLLIFVSFFLITETGWFDWAYNPLKFSDFFGVILFLHIFFFPNLAQLFYTTGPLSSQSWSIGVEEQFYLFWPVLVSKMKMTIKFFIYFILIVWFLKHLVVVVALLSGKEYEAFPYLHYMRRIFYNARFDSMAIGGLYALLFDRDQLWFKTFLSKYKINIFLPILLTVLCLLAIRPPIIFHEIYSVLFGLLIICIILFTDKSSFLENKWLNYFGKISYGIYMYHLIPIGFALVYLKEYRHITEFSLSMSIALQAFAICSTILISAISYELMEKRLLRLKNKYSIIKSGDEFNEKK